MSFYLDTSVVVSVLTEEIHTGLAEQWLLSNWETPLLISWWVDVEWHSAIARKLFAGTLDEKSHAIANSAFEQLTINSLDMVPVEKWHFTSACDLASRAPGLRAGDALHLAISAAHDATICTLDRGMAAAASTLGHPHVLIGYQTE